MRRAPCGPRGRGAYQRGWGRRSARSRPGWTGQTRRQQTSSRRRPGARLASARPSWPHPSAIHRHSRQGNHWPMATCFTPPPFPSLLADERARSDAGNGLQDASPRGAAYCSRARPLGRVAGPQDGDAAERDARRPRRRGRKPQRDDEHGLAAGKQQLQQQQQQCPARKGLGSRAARAVGAHGPAAARRSRRRRRRRRRRRGGRSARG